MPGVRSPPEGQSRRAVHPGGACGNLSTCRCDPGPSLRPTGERSVSRRASASRPARNARSAGLRVKLSARSRAPQASARSPSRASRSPGWRGTGGSPRGRQTVDDRQRARRRRPPRRPRRRGSAARPGTARPRTAPRRAERSRPSRSRDRSRAQPPSGPGVLGGDRGLELVRPRRRRRNAAVSTRSPSSIARVSQRDRSWSASRTSDPESGSTRTARRESWSSISATRPRASGSSGIRAASSLPSRIASAHSSSRSRPSPAVAV